MSVTKPADAKHLSEHFDPFHDPYLADPYPFFAQARDATPVFYSPLGGHPLSLAVSECVMRPMRASAREQPQNRPTQRIRELQLGH
jgi:hypothetical protein